ncbi:hypothetical protein ACVINW_006485 [Bradyrhizobium sp. USDA 4461]
MSSIIAVTFIFIRRNLEADMSGAGDGRQEPPEDEGNRGIENAVMFGFFAVLVAVGIWLLGTMADIRESPGLRSAGATQLCYRRVAGTGAIGLRSGDARCGRQCC